MHFSDGAPRSYAQENDAFEGKGWAVTVKGAVAMVERVAKGNRPGWRC
jgi:hypothetical protein